MNTSKIKKDAKTITNVITKLGNREKAYLFSEVSELLLKRQHELTAYQFRDMSKTYNAMPD